MIVRASCGSCAIASSQLAARGLPNRCSSQSIFAPLRLVDMLAFGSSSSCAEAFQDGISNEGCVSVIEPSKFCGEGMTRDFTRPGSRLKITR